MLHAPLVLLQGSIEVAAALLDVAPDAPRQPRVRVRVDENLHVKKGSHRRVVKSQDTLTPVTKPGTQANQMSTLHQWFHVFLAMRTSNMTIEGNSMVESKLDGRTYTSVIDAYCHRREKSQSRM